ncbi:hypothetical protein MWU75_13395 [Ornithinimicrobium sp. F0845]|uniref:hypothetical protein n=1 Tax=Ornithinimicrobium sp. F0845 TaxID=2926412 RepID=UPI001FF45BB2|nr:hypothetical protein [Ornithinimicrobium sp. F0845]MCK0113139.1 hypothetical protein [Ornithinimicrobium sp. F0845]
MMPSRWERQDGVAAESTGLRGDTAVRDMVSGTGQRSTSELLRHLLTGDSAYRRRWRAEVRRASARDPHQSAVAAVLADHLWDTGEVPESDTDLPRRLKDVVARAVSGRGISHQTLGWFVRAFDMKDEHERALWQQLEADLRADPPAVPGGPRRRASPVPPEHPENPQTSASYRTQSLIEQFEVGADRSRRRHALEHIIRAQGLVERVTYRFDTPEVRVEVARGGVPGPLRADDAPGMFRIDIELPAPLEPGQTTVLETIATYPAGGPVTHHFRRGLRETAGGVSLEVRFDPDAVPERVRWVELVDAGTGVAATEEVPLPPDHVVHRFLTPARDCAVGFEWDW